MRARAAWLVALVVGAVLLDVTGAMAQPARRPPRPYPPGAAVACDRTEGLPGSTRTCSSPGFAPGSQVVVLVAGDGFEITDEVSADAHGVATLTFVIPQDAVPGPATVSFTGHDISGGPRTATTTFNVATDVGALEPDGPLGTTGASMSNGLLVALGIALAGGALVVAERRRERDVAGNARGR